MFEKEELLKESATHTHYLIEMDFRIVMKRDVHIRTKSEVKVQDLHIVRFIPKIIVNYLFLSMLMILSTHDLYIRCLFKVCMD